MKHYEIQTKLAGPKTIKSPTAIEYEKLLLDPPYKGMDCADLWDLAMKRTAK